MALSENFERIALEEKQLRLPRLLAAIAQILEIVITGLPGPPSCAPRRCVLDDSSHTSCLS